MESGQAISVRMACYSITKKRVTKINILLHMILKNFVMNNPAAEKALSDSTDVGGILTRALNRKFKFSDNTIVLDKDAITIVFGDYFEISSLLNNKRTQF